jgi:hypothetical protein
MGLETLPSRDTDSINSIMAHARTSPHAADPNRFKITNKLCSQYVHNHAKRTTDSYVMFTPDNHTCFMNNADKAEFVSI